MSGRNLYNKSILKVNNVVNGKRKSRTVNIGGVKIGGGNRIAVQSMLNIPINLNGKGENPETEFTAAVEQLRSLKNAGCDIVRVAIVDFDSIYALEKLKNAMVTDPSLSVPLVADIHFNYRLAVEAVFAGIDKIRINPGNIGSDEKVKEVADVCRSHGVPIRIGVNSGSLEREILAKHGAPTAHALAESAMYHVKLLEKYDFKDIVISIKASNVAAMIEANRYAADLCDYPLHLGLTASGAAHLGLLKNVIGIGSLLNDGIGDTIRVSLTANPILEVYEGINILKALDLYDNYIELISCPTCGRCSVDVIGVTNECERRIQTFERENTIPGKIKVAVMGCAVNGPGEAKEADFGIAGMRDGFQFFRKGEKICTVGKENAADFLMDEIMSLCKNFS